MNRCSWCDAEFVKDHPQQIYCSIECRTEASKESARRYAKVAKYKARVGKKRLCKTCKTPLSVYNDHQLCSVCYVKNDAVRRALKNIKAYIDYEKQ